jgi:tetratricopeptide (TPR) repeat protein
MKPRSLPWVQRKWLLGAACLIAALLVKPVQDRIDAHLNRASIDPDLLYFSSPAAVKAVAVGYDGLLADVYWMRAIQYYGRRAEAARRQVKYKNLPALLDIVTTLDSKMLDVYRAGSIFLAEPDPIGAGQPMAAVALLDKGISQLPGDWRLWFDKGFVYFWYLRDFKRAGEVWLGACSVAGSPPWMEALAARALSQGGEIETAKDLWRHQLEGSAREDVKENARNHLASIQVDEDIWTLEFFVEKYAAIHGASPARLEELVRAGFLIYVPKDPSGVSYQYDPSAGAVRLSAESKVHYLALPYNYRESFRERLARLYQSNQQMKK